MKTKDEVAKKRVNKFRKDIHLNELCDYAKYEKNWKHMYTRSQKMKRAEQLGFTYPRINLNNTNHY